MNNLTVLSFKGVCDIFILLAIWMDGRRLKFTSLSTALLSYQDNRKIILICCVLLNPAYSVKNSGDGFQPGTIAQLTSAY